MTVFELSYQQRDGCSGLEPIWLRAAGKARNPKEGSRNERVD